MTHFPTSVIPANAGVHGLERLPDRTIINRTSSMGPGVRRDDGGLWKRSHLSDLPISPEPPQ